MDDTVRDTLERCLPELEPPMRLQLQDVIRRGRRRRRIRTLTPAGAATAAVLMIGSVFAAAGPPPPAELPPSPPTRTSTSLAGPSSSPNSAVPVPPWVQTGQRPPTSAPSGSSGVPATPGTVAPPTSGTGLPVPTTAPAPGGPLYEFRAPPGHSVNWAGQNMTEFVIAQLPPHRIIVYNGTLSDTTDSAGGHAIGGHMLWQDDAGYGYMFWMYRHSLGEFPITAYGLPVEPCVDPTRPAPGETCEIRPRANGWTDVLFDVDRGYRMRGVVQHRPDPNGGVGHVATLGFYLPPPGGGWPRYPNLVGQRLLPDIPYTAEEMSRAVF